MLCMTFVQPIEIVATECEIFNFVVVIIFWTLQIESYHGSFNLYS